MPRHLDTLDAVAGDVDAIVLDQFGVLHDGTAPYPGAVAALARLQAAGVRLAVLSNSGKRAAPNAARIAAMGFAEIRFDTVMTSGEALWRDIAAGRVPAGVLCPIDRAPGDAADWAVGLDVTLTDDPARADAILLMGLADAADPMAARDVLAAALARDIPVLCSNPDRAAPRAGGVTVTSPGTLAHAHAAAGGTVRFYGKPHAPVFRAVETALGLSPDRLLMVGDSLEHDVAGARAAGWRAVFVMGGLHAADFAPPAARGDVLARLAAAAAAPMPDFTLPELC